MNLTIFKVGAFLVITTVLIGSHPPSAAQSGAASGGGGSCGEVVFDCSRKELKIGGKAAGQIACGTQTGKQGKKAGECKIGDVTPASGSAGLKPGTPVMQAVPVQCLCDNCAIHVGGVGKGKYSKGCVHTTQEQFNDLKKCKGTRFSVIPEGGGGNGGRSYASDAGGSAS